VTPSYNQADFIVWTVRSVLLQRYPELEYILMDGGSDDRTLELLRPYEARFAHFQSMPDGGQSAAIAAGFERSTGSIMAWLNSDDVLAPGALHVVARFFDEHPEIDALYSHRCIVDERNDATGYWILPPHSDHKMMRWDLIPQETCFWRRSLFEKCGNVDPSFRFAMDYDLFVRFMRAGRFARLPRFLGAFRKHPAAKTSQQLETVGEEEVRRVRDTYGITIGALDRWIGRGFWHRMHARSNRHARRRRTLPGALAGTGWNYDRAWGGLLGGTDLPPL
jgi:glycosyltransferase involved in cell wall biosynthesis